MSGPQGTQAGAGGADFRPRVERLLTDILGLMGFPARLDLQDAADGSLSVALHFESGPPPGVEPGKRSQVLDSLQFLLNKMLHRPGVERRWVMLGAGGHPEPRPRREAAQQAPAPAPAATVAQVAAAPAPAQPARVAQEKAAQPARPARGAQPAAQTPKASTPQQAKGAEADERSVQCEEDAVLREAVRKLAEKSASLGRFYAFAAMKTEDRARVLRAVEGVGGVKVAAEGEGRNRRVVFTPAKPAPMPKRSMLPDDDEDDVDA
ncbi:hypothetical protein OV207_00645 [Corallococcus sp. BB11-1]|uniref:hypothetical protein n=1 Tax=Corallococcus sp. BB11-1 TaxID=2996783 RepID=UPI00226DD4E3|nr:hypothetical protein [Corallococcus sp. BB11-1]MCY1029951.1 hypothetical protein [Corallococcus sp. BB11-1]